MASTSARPVVIVTGASRGIGAAIARLAGARGFAVAVNYRSSPEAARQVAGDIEAAGGRALAIEADVAEEAAVLRLFDAAASALGPVTALVNNAGITGRSGRFAALTPQAIEEVFRLNVTGAFICAREAVRRAQRAVVDANPAGCVDVGGVPRGQRARRPDRRVTHGRDRTRQGYAALGRRR